jgi:symplekin
MPEVKQEPRPEVKKELNIAKLALPRIPDNIQVSIKVMPPKRTPTQLPSRPVVVVSDAVTVAALPSRVNEEVGKAADKDVKMEAKSADSEESRRLLKQETFQVKPFEPTVDRPVVDAAQPPTKKPLELAFERILGSEHLVSVPGMTGRKMLEAAASGNRPETADGGAAEAAEGAVVPFDNDSANEHATKVVTKADWMSIVSRLLTRVFPRNSDEVAASGVQSMKERMVDYICQDFKQRRELALTWLHEEWYYEGMCRRQSSGDMDDREPQYLWCLYKILDGITSGADYDAKDRGLTRFLLEVPELPDGAVDMIQKYCDDPLRAQQGIVCLRDVVNLRPPSRARALELLLSYTTYPEKLQRSMAIVMAKKWYLEHSTVGPQVEEFALAQLDALRDYPVPKRAADAPVTSQEGSGAAMEGVVRTSPGISHRGSTDAAVKTEVKDEPMDNHDLPRSSIVASEISGAEGGISGEAFEQALTVAHDDIARLLELYFSLCAKNHSLLGVLLSQYSAFNPFVQRVVRQTIHPLIKSIKSDSTKLLALIRDFPLGAEMLVLRIIFILTDGGIFFFFFFFDYCEEIAWNCSPCVSVSSSV